MYARHSGTKSKTMERMTLYYMSDSSHPELGLVPWYEACKARWNPFFRSMSICAFTPFGMRKELLSSSNKILGYQYGAPAYNNSSIRWSELSEKGNWLLGSGIQKELCSVSLMLVIKYKTKNSQKYFARMHWLTVQMKCAVAETDVKRVLLSDQSQFYVGACVSVGS